MPGDRIGRVLIVVGLVVVVLGLIFLLLGRTPLGRLPGDILFSNGNFTCFVPIVSMILLSLLLTVVLNIVIRLFNR
jgi:hypothetical protein